MSEIVTKKDEYMYFTNGITRELDSHINDIQEMESSGFRTYIYDNLSGNKWLIRYPGATRGYVEVDTKDKIIAIVVYDEHVGSSELYKESVMLNLFKFVGKTFVVRR